MPGRNFTSSLYRYGFNGEELDPEGLGGGGSTYDYGFRIYNPNLGRFLSVDPLSPNFPWYTPYQFSGNLPTRFTDLDGKETFDEMMNGFVTASNAALKIYGEYENQIDASLTMLGGVLTTAAGIVITPVCPICGIVAITYGVANTGYGMAKLADSFNETSKQNPDLNKSNNFGQLTGNELEKVGLDGAGSTGYYTGEAIDLTAGGIKAAYKLYKFAGLFEAGKSTMVDQIKAGYNTYKLLSKTADLAILGASATYDAFIAEADNQLSDITSLNQKIDFIPNATGATIHIQWEATDKAGNKVVREFNVITEKEKGSSQNDNSTNQNTSVEGNQTKLNKKIEYKVEKVKK